MATGLRLTVNGQQKLLDGLSDPAALDNVLTALAMKADRVAVEHNGEIAPRSTWSGVQVVSGDRLEVVHFVGGGAGLKQFCAGSTADRCRRSATGLGFARELLK